jgi:hypothetical protein
MGAKDRTTTIKLDPFAREWLKALAKARHRSVHALMKEAIDHYLARQAGDGFAYQMEQLKGKPLEARYRVAVTQSRPRTVGLPVHVKEQIAAGNNRVRVLRGWRGLTVAAVAARLADLGSGASQRELEEIEDDRRTPGPGLLGAIATALDVTVDDLLE